VNFTVLLGKKKGMESSALCRLFLQLQTSKHLSKDSYSGIMKVLKPEMWQMPENFCLCPVEM